MKKSSVAMIVGATAIVVGCVIAAVGTYVSGGLYGISVDSDGVHMGKVLSLDTGLGGWSVEQTENTGLAGEVYSDMVESFTSIDIDVIAANVQIIAADEDKVEYQLSKFEEVKEFGVTNGKLILKTKSRPTVNFGVLNQGGSYVRIYSKNLSKMEDISVTTVSSEIEVNGASAEKMAFSSVSGDINVGDLIVTDDIAFSTTSGNTKGKRIQTNKIKSSSVSGYSNLANINAKSGNYSAVSGNIDVGGELLGEHVANTVSGDITYSSTLSKSEYTCAVSSVTGKGHINGVQFTHTDGTGPNKLHGGATSGSIRFNLAK